MILKNISDNLLSLTNITKEIRGDRMTKEVATNIQSTRTNSTPAYRTKKLAHLFRAISLFAMPIRCSELGLRRRK